MKRFCKVAGITNNPLRIVCATICIIVLVAFVLWLLLWIVWWYKYDLYLMKAWIWTCVISGICMGILHILYFRTPKKFKKKLFGDQYEQFKNVK